MSSETSNEPTVKEVKQLVNAFDHNQVDVDWLYRNKKKSTKRSVSSSVKKDDLLKKTSPTITPEQSNINTEQKQENQENQDKLPAEPPSVSDKQAKLRPAKPPPKAIPLTSQKTSLLSKALRPRSNSDPRRGTQPSAPPLKPSLSSSLSSSSSSSSSSSPTTSSLPSQKQQVSTSSTTTAGTPAESSLARSNSLNESSKPQKPIKSLFSAFSNKLKNKSAPTSPQTSPVSIPNSQQKQPSHKLSSSIESISPTLGNAFFLQTPIPEESRVVLNKNPNRSELPIKELSTLKLRRVTFALDKLADDPPQQIPSRRPKRGNVIVIDDLLQNDPIRLSVGIANESKVESLKYDEKEIKLIKDAQRRALEEAEKHAQEAHKSAQRIAIEVVGFKNKPKRQQGHELELEQEVDTLIAEGVSDLEIDKPIHLHEHHFEDEIINNEDLHIEISLENIYTRCCHLREILPIPATLKQLKGKTSPLQVLKLLNPKPTLIDVYSFCDFIAIVPIKTLIFDNVSLTTEMLKIVLSSILNSSSIEKLSLRNVPIDSTGWKLLAKFLSRNKQLSKLDISQQKIKSDLSKNFHRSEMDWKLFIHTLVLRGGIEELVINGCKLTNVDFESLVNTVLPLKTKRFGIAQIGLTLEQFQMLIDGWLLKPGSPYEGLDLGFNDLNYIFSKHEIFKKFSKLMNLQSISINSTSLNNVEDVALFIRALSKLPNVRFLDLSNLKQIFPGILPYLNKYLPRFKNLKRIHFDFNDLSTKSIAIISEIIPKCENLVHVSIIGLSTISYSGAASLYGAVKSSKTLVNFDLEYDLIDDENINSKIAMCLMRNMEKSLMNEHYIGDTMGDALGDSHDDMLFDGSLIAQTAGRIIDKISNNKLHKDEEEGSKDEFSEEFLKTQFLDKITNFRAKINKTIDDLLRIREEQHVQLSLKEKEHLLRFYFLENSLAKIEELFQTLTSSKQSEQSQQQLQQPAQPTEPHQMAVEVSNGGQETPIDVATGRPIFLRSVSQTSIQAKKQEEEEGEFHKWGFFVQQQRQILPQTQPEPTIPKVKGNEFIVPQLPSGEEIRDAVIKAKGIDSITSLIDNVNNHRFSLKKIYPGIKEENEHLYHSKFEDNKDSISPSNSNGHHSNNDHAGEEHEGNGDDVNDGDDFEVDEAYDKILNDLSRVRSNK